MKSKLYNKKIILLVGGPTASGKSKLALKLAKLINGEIINADSMQVYKNFPILTSQPNENDRKLIRHHLYGYIDTTQNCNGAIWLKDSMMQIKKLLSMNKIPIVVGGTGLYLEFLSKGISFIPEITINTKKIVNEELIRKGLKGMYQLLTNIDTDYSKKINPNDKTRIIRAIEVFYQTNKSISYFHRKKKQQFPLNFFKIYLSPSKNEIKENSIVRLKNMIKEGLLEEFKKNIGKVNNCNIVKAIGFKEINEYFSKQYSLEDLSNVILKNTRNYAKRQFTWFNNRYYPQIKVNSYKKTSLILESLSKIN